MTLSEYLSPSQIILFLSKYRVVEARKRHPLHLYLKISKNDKAKKSLNEFEEGLVILSQILPPRRKWVKLNLEDRKKIHNSTNSDIERIRRTIAKVHLKISEGKLSPPIWYEKLQAFISDVIISIEPNSSYKISIPEIIPERKDNVGNQYTFRPLTNYSYKDRIIIGAAAKYLTDIFDKYLIHESSFAFRSVKDVKKMDIITHHKAIKEIIKYRLENDKRDIWAAECDIKKFFDCVSHSVAIEAFEEFSNKLGNDGVLIDERARIIFYQYLQSYSFNNDVIKYNKTKYFLQHYPKISYANCSFEWPLQELKDLYVIENDFSIERIGIPQGGALSCLIANLVMHKVDEAVVSTSSSEIKYIRYCDDMVILTRNRNVCLDALQRYVAQLIKSKLVVHRPIEVEKYDKKYWASSNKSKYPYRWACNTHCEANVPWLSFVGYQVRFDGTIRIRPKSIRKEIDKQIKYKEKIIKKIHNDQKPHKVDVNSTSKKSINQQCYALESHLISMAVGRISLKNLKEYKPTLCWTIGFTEINKNPIVEKQLKALDINRNKCILDFRRALQPLTRKSSKIEIDKKNYRGCPFSYYGSLNKK